MPKLRWLIRSFTTRTVDRCTGQFRLERREERVLQFLDEYGDWEDVEEVQCEDSRRKADEAVMAEHRS